MNHNFVKTYLDRFKDTPTTWAQELIRSVFSERRFALNKGEKMAA